MATLASGSRLTIAELLRRETPDGRLADIVDVLSQTNAIIVDATAIECNNGTYHKDTRAATEPTGSERAYDQGVASEAGVTETVVEPTAMIDGLSEVDAAKLQHTPDPLGARSQEDGFFMRGMGKTFASRLFDGDRATSPLRINGINNRADYNALSSSYTYDNGEGSTADDTNFTSIYLVQWGPKQVNLIYPRNDVLAARGGDEMSHGISKQDFGRQIIVDPNDSTKKFPAWQTWFELHFGLFIHDPRKIRRLCNIATSSINGTTYKSFHEDHLIDMYNDALNDGGLEGAVFYANATAFAQIQKRANIKGNAHFTQQSEGEGPFAHQVTRFWGIPVHLVAQITNTQADIT
tara:strand:- start:3362 stop:4411 length:1050 start_codon:yes stop_codon:yes gene_type:complete